VAQRTSNDAVRRTLTVAAPRERAFAVFTDGLATWWPREYTWGRDVLETIAIEPREGGRCYERGPHDFQCDWGRVLAWNPPHQLVISWQISPHREPEPNPAKASEVDVRFMAEGPASTRVEFEHRELTRHDEEGMSYRDALNSPEGWTYILDCYVRSIDQ
jgi:uncharacterized protein YndB with AHSA1/START domain